jgi:hypothetical protein
MRLNRASLPSQSSLAVWTDRPFLYLRAARLILRSAIHLFRAKLLPRRALLIAYGISSAVARRGLQLRIRARWRNQQRRRGRVWR